MCLAVGGHLGWSHCDHCGLCRGRCGNVAGPGCAAWAPGVQLSILGQLRDFLDSKAGTGVPGHVCKQGSPCAQSVAHWAWAAGPRSSQHPRIQAAPGLPELSGWRADSSCVVRGPCARESLRGPARPECPSRVTHDLICQCRHLTQEHKSQGSAGQNVSHPTVRQAVQAPEREQERGALSLCPQPDPAPPPPPCTRPPASLPQPTWPGWAPDAPRVPSADSSEAPRPPAYCP